MAKRKAISNKTRFEVFKRDSFKCQYCGASAPEVILHVDHIKPVAKGGTNEITNLITSCATCNGGKSATPLDDNSTLEKQRKQLEELNERRAQLEMMMKWRDELGNIDETKIRYVQEKFENLADCSITESGMNKLRKVIKKYPLETVLDSIELATEQYLVPEEDGGYTSESQGKAFNYIERICANKQRVKDKPYLKDLFYIRGILKNRLSYMDQYKALRYLEEAHELGMSIDDLKDIGMNVRNWTQFKTTMEEIIGS